MYTLTVAALPGNVQTQSASTGRSIAPKTKFCWGLYLGLNASVYINDQQHHVDDLGAANDCFYQGSMARAVNKRDLYFIIW